jgi:hypothetical protein
VRVSAKRLLCRKTLLVVMGYTDLWILHVYGILLPGRRRQEQCHCKWLSVIVALYASLRQATISTR